MNKCYLFLFVMVTLYSCTPQDPPDNLNPQDPHNTFTDSRDDNVYKTVTIGEQVWMAENLGYLPSVNYSALSYEAPENETDAFYYVFLYFGTDVTAAKATNNYKTYGVLYNWPAALTACPEGWHLPNDVEWTELENYLIANGYNYDGTTTSNKIAISLANAKGWLASDVVGAIGNTNTAYDAYRNKSGFSALPGGYRSNMGPFIGVGDFGIWWSSTQYDTYEAWYRILNYNYSDFYRYHVTKKRGFSVRCVRDSD